MYRLQHILERYAQANPAGRVIGGKLRHRVLREWPIKQAHSTGRLDTGELKVLEQFQAQQAHRLSGVLKDTLSVQGQGTGKG